MSASLNRSRYRLFPLELTPKQVIPLSFRVSFACRRTTPAFPSLISQSCTQLKSKPMLGSGPRIGDGGGEGGEAGLEAGAGAETGPATRGKSSFQINSFSDSTRFSARSARSSTCFKRASIRSSWSVFAFAFAFRLVVALGLVETDFFRGGDFRL